MTEQKPFPNFLGKIERGNLLDFADAVVLTEKMDGSYFQFGWYEGEFRMRTKNTQDYEGIPKMFSKVVKELNEHKDTFPKNVIFCCEYFQKPKHNAICYDFSSIGDIDKDSCFLFIIYVRSLTDNPNEGIWLFPGKFGNCYIGYVPDVTYANYSDPCQMAESAYGAIREGIVMTNARGERFKYVTDHFKEVHVGQRKPKRQHPELDSVWFPYIAGLKARVNKAIFRLKEAGIEFNKSTFGKVIGSTVNDLLDEESQNIKEELFRFHEKSFKKKVNAAIVDILFDKLREEPLSER